MRVRWLVSLGVVFGVVAVTAQSGSNSQGVHGVWRAVEVTRTGEAASPNTQAQPSLFIFMGKHYALLRVTAGQPRPSLADPAKATAAQLLAVWGNDGFVANAGTYEVRGTNLTIRPLVAKNPDVMKPGFFITYAFKLGGNTLVLTETRDVDGPATYPTTLRLTRLE